MRNNLGILTLNQQVTGSSRLGARIGAKSKDFSAFFYVLFQNPTVFNLF
jgi:hypothetical protein